MPSEKPIIAIRTTPKLKKQITYIAEENNRSVSKEIEMLIKKHVKQYEEYNGEIKIIEE